MKCVLVFPKQIMKTCQMIFKVYLQKLIENLLRHIVQHALDWRNLNANHEGKHDFERHKKNCSFFL